MESELNLVFKYATYIMIGILIIWFVGALHLQYSLTKAMYYCVDQLPVQPKGSISGSTWNMEQGYVECCYDVLENHRWVKNCTVMRYKDG